MKSTIRSFLLLLAMTIVFVGCGEVNELNPFASDDEFVDAFNNQAVSGAAQTLINNISCNNAGYGGNVRFISRFTTSGAYANGYAGQLQRGHIGGALQSIFVGVSVVGDIIEVAQLNNGRANITIHMCEFQPLIYAQRQIQDAFLTQAIVTNARPDCQVNEVTSASFLVRVPGVNNQQGYLPPADFPVTFSRYQDFAPQLCNNGFFGF